MTAEFDYDLFVIGAGSGGVRAARMAAAKGFKIALPKALSGWNLCQCGLCPQEAVCLRLPIFRAVSCQQGLWLVHRRPDQP